MKEFLRVQVRFPRDVGIPEDDVVNVWHFRASVPDADETSDQLLTDLIAFYDTIASMYASTLANPGVFKVYDLEEAEPRAPIDQRNANFTFGEGLALPNEIALALSMRADLVSGTNPARRRGRVYLGPWDDGIQEVSGSDVRPSAATRTAIMDAAATLFSVGGLFPSQLSVYSPTTDAVVGNTLDDAFFQVEHMWCDNSFDIQRRRGASPTTRTTRDRP